MKTMLFLILAILLGLGAAMLYRAPVQQYVVACERTTQVACVLEQTRSVGTQRKRVTLGPHASAVVRLMPQRRHSPRVLLYLASAPGEIFAAEFEGVDAEAAAAAAAVQLNNVLDAPAPAVARVEVAPPRLFRWFAWGGLGVMGLLLLVGYRDLRSRPRAA